jgi:predicted CoA-binding protein
MSNADGVTLLREARAVLLIDWPSRAVPDSLARAGLYVVSEDGPDLFNEYARSGDEITVRRVGTPPPSVDLVYAYRPLDELRDIAARAARLGARALWVEHLGRDELDAARMTALAAGLALVTTPIIDAAAAVRAARATTAD